ncbi:hypothetical protein K469DRAFT_685593 [Zopfia rhizophila CBS 207.26]|uniref:Uncharacterized protein n=1 Tax=Zopfia rhizophila CBS 207.26 TaxID=1314779 RepID=A0A6A6EAA6_9PEZI|nr:hypothetical protein K469DRAFT_685593 [Zopfia rhizophila CBS 207.26]
MSPATARLIFAQRLGLSQFHSIKDANDEVIEQINAYGGRQRKLFGGDEDRNNAHALIWIDDVEDIAGFIQDSKEYSAEFTITNPPSASENQRLIQDMILQAESLPKKPDPRGVTYSTGFEIAEILDYLKQTNTYNEYLTIFKADKNDKLSPSDLSTSISKLVRKKSFPITVVLTPPSSSKAKRSAHPYGTYDLPSTIQARRENTEALLSPSSSQPSAAAAQNVSPQNLEDFPHISETDETRPVLGILPSCFATLATCEEQTHNCTGHGACMLLHKGETGKDARVKDCYGCHCEATVVEVRDGKKTTYWGGPACQKKDVSVPFWLFVGSGVILAFLISTGIGMLYSMGSEELPSVIGAGVSGPARK